MQTLRGVYSEVLQSCPKKTTFLNNANIFEIENNLRSLISDNAFYTRDMFCLLFNSMCFFVSNEESLPDNQSAFLKYLEAYLHKYELKKYLYDRYAYDSLKPASKTKCSSCEYFFLILILLTGFCLVTDIRYLNTCLKLGDQISGMENELLGRVYKEKIYPVIVNIVDSL